MDKFREIKAATETHNAIKEESAISGEMDVTNKTSEFVNCETEFDEVVVKVKKEIEESFEDFVGTETTDKPCFSKLNNTVLVKRETELIIPADGVEIESQDQLIKKEYIDQEADLCETDEIEVKNPGTKKFVCGICGSEYNSRKCFRSHQKRHENPDMYKCNICDKRFSASSSLRYHLNTHENPDTYKCNICDKRYSSRTVLRVHLKSHEKPAKIKCKVCKKAFIRPYHLAKHLKTHPETSLNCKFCNKKFSMHSKRLELHEKICPKNNKRNRTKRKRNKLHGDKEN